MGPETGIVPEIHGGVQGVIVEFPLIVILHAAVNDDIAAHLLFRPVRIHLYIAGGIQVISLAHDEGVIGVHVHRCPVSDIDGTGIHVSVYSQALLAQNFHAPVRNDDIVRHVRGIDGAVDGHGRYGQIEVRGNRGLIAVPDIGELQIFESQGAIVRTLFYRSCRPVRSVRGQGVFRSAGNRGQKTLQDFDIVRADTLRGGTREELYIILVLPIEEALEIAVAEGFLRGPAGVVCDDIVVAGPDGVARDPLQAGPDFLHARVGGREVRLGFSLGQAQDVDVVGGVEKGAAEQENDEGRDDHNKETCAGIPAQSLFRLFDSLFQTHCHTACPFGFTS